MKKNILSYILSAAMCLMLAFSCFAQANPSLTSVTISPAPVVYPNGTAKLTFSLYNDGDATSSSSVRVQIGLQKLDFTNSMFNVGTDITSTPVESPAPFTWSYNATTKTLTGTLNGNFAQFASYNVEIRNLNVTAASDMANPTVGCNINIVAPTAVNSSNLDDNVSTFTYTTTVIPVGLLSFEASKLGDCESKVTWASTEEINFDYYQLEQSTDSKTFLEVGSTQIKKGANSKYEQISELKSAKGNYVYYRLRMVDLDRTTRYSKIVSVQNDCSKKNSPVIAPNPAKDFINISEVYTTGDLYIFDMFGRQILKATLNDSGNQNVNISNLIQGTYMIQIASEQGTYYSKLIKQ